MISLPSVLPLPFFCPLCTISFVFRSSPPRPQYTHAQNNDIGISILRYEATTWIFCDLLSCVCTGENVDATRHNVGNMDQEFIFFYGFSRSWIIWYDMIYFFFSSVGTFFFLYHGSLNTEIGIWHSWTFTASIIHNRSRDRKKGKIQGDFGVVRGDAVRWHFVLFWSRLVQYSTVQPGSTYVPT